MFKKIAPALASKDELRKIPLFGYLSDLNDTIWIERTKEDMNKAVF